MRICTGVIFFASVAQASGTDPRAEHLGDASKLVEKAHVRDLEANRSGDAPGFVDRLVDRALETWHRRHADLDDAVIGKPGRFNIRSSTNLMHNTGIACMPKSSCHLGFPPDRIPKGIRIMDPRCTKLLKSRSLHIPQGVMNHPGDAQRNHKGLLTYHCDLCDVAVGKKRMFEQHIAGKNHQQAEAQSEVHWARYVASPWFDAGAPKPAVTHVFSFDKFLDGLKRRSRTSGGGLLFCANDDGWGCLSPSVTLSKLSPEKRAMLFRYLEEHCKDARYADVLIRLEKSGQDLRIKEVLESVETYRLVVRLIENIKKRGKGLQPSINSISGRSSSTSSSLIDAVHDVACGHGLVGLLLAASQPSIHLFSCDLSRSAAYDAHVDAWRAEGFPLRNVHFLPGEFTKIYGEGRMRENGDAAAMQLQWPPCSGRSLLLCVHGCNEVSEDAIRIARSVGMGWLVVPCCMPQNLLRSVSNLRLCDEQRYTMLCGVLSERHEAQIVRSLDMRVTRRPIVLGDLHVLEDRKSSDTEFDSHKKALRVRRRTNRTTASERKVRLVDDKGMLVTSKS